MADNDDAGCIFAPYEAVTVVDPDEEQAIIEASLLELPFDLYKIVDTNPYIFDDLGESDRTGEYCRYMGGDVHDLSGAVHPAPGVIGVIVGDAFGRVVIAFQTDDNELVYLGWVNDDEIEVVQVREEVHQWLH